MGLHLASAFEQIADLKRRQPALIGDTGVRSWRDFDARAARILGVDTNKVYATTFALNAAICGAAGGLVVMTWVIQPFAGLAYTIRSFMIVIVAGLGNVAGVVFAGLGLGAAENIAGFVFGAEFQAAFVFALLVVILLYRNFKLRLQRRYLK